MPSDHPGPSEEDIRARGGWHPRYARVVAIGSDGDYGFAVVDGNGDGTELEAEMWAWDGGAWHDAGSSGAGPLGHLGPVRTGGHIGDACFAYGSAPGRTSVTISFDRRRYDVPVSRHGVWAFVKVPADPHPRDPPALTT